MNPMYFVDRYFIKKPTFRRTVTRLLYGSCDRSIELFNTRLFVNSVQENGYLRASRTVATSSLFRDELSVMLQLTHFVRPAGMFIDAGANIGVYSIVFSKFKSLYPDFEVKSFEVHPDTFSRLQKNSNTHRFDAYPFGLSNDSREVEFLSGAVSHVTTTREHAGKYTTPGGEFVAQCHPLSHFQYRSCDIILKIDVEGQELDVLRGATELFDNRQIICTYVDGYSDSRVKSFLESYGFEIHDGRTLAKASGDVFSLLAIRR